MSRLTSLDCAGRIDFLVSPPQVMMCSHLVFAVVCALAALASPALAQSTLMIVATLNSANVYPVPAKPSTMTGAFMM